MSLTPPTLTTNSAYKARKTLAHDLADHALLKAGGQLQYWYAK